MWLALLLMLSCQKSWSASGSPLPFPRGRPVEAPFMSPLITPPKWYLFIILLVAKSWSERWELTPSHSITQVSNAGLLTVSNFNHLSHHAVPRSWHLHAAAVEERRGWKARGFLSFSLAYLPIPPLANSSAPPSHLFWPLLHLPYFCALPSPLEVFMIDLSVQMARPILALSFSSYKVGQ